MKFVTLILDQLKKPNDRVGFTLIEVMIAISLGALVLTVGTANYIDFNKTQAIKQAGLTVKNNLRQVQTKVTTGVKPSSCGASTLDGYKVTLASTSFTADAVCGGSPSGNVTTYNLPAGLFFDTAAPTTTTFNVLGNGVTTAKQVLIKNSSASPTKWYSLFISTSGEIKDCGYTNGTTPPACN